MKRPPVRDWFGLEAFNPGSARSQEDSVVLLLESVGSTNDFLLGRGDGAVGRPCRWGGWGWQAGAQQRLLPPAAPAPGSVVVARRQTQGRGRRGRDWLNTNGLMMSWLVPPVPARGVTGLAVWTGLIAALVLRDKFALPVQVKWPNDLVIAGRKLGGLLLEAARTDAGPVMVAGLGLNLRVRTHELPPVLRAYATSFMIETGHSPRPATVAGELLRRFDAELPLFRAEGWTQFRDRYRECDSLRGCWVELETGCGVVNGRVAGIDATGALVLRRSDGREMRLLAGDVHVREVAAPDGGRGGEQVARSGR